MSLSQLDDDLILLRSRLAERERELAAVREAAADAAEAAAWRLEAARQEAAALRCALEEAHALASDEPESEPVAEILAEVTTAATMPSPAPSLPIAAPRRRSLRRVMALPVWRLVRPVARPALWRVRNFFAADTLRELAALRAAQDAMQEAARDAVRDAVQEALGRIALPPAAGAEAPCQASGPSHGLGLGDTAAERWLLTVALECGRG